MQGFTVRGNVGIFLGEFVIVQKISQSMIYEVLRKERVNLGYSYVKYKESLPQEMSLAPVCETNNDTLR